MTRTIQFVARARWSAPLQRYALLALLEQLVDQLTREFGVSADQVLCLEVEVCLPVATRRQLALISCRAVVTC